MVKTILIIHGWGGSSDEPIINFMKEKFEKEGYETITPDMPETDDPKPILWLNMIKEELGKVDKNTYFVGHSIGCIAILRFIESLRENEKVGGIILVAPWMGLDEESIDEVGQKEAEEITNRWFSKPINWEKIRMIVKKVVCVYSDDDPFVPLEGKELFIKELKAKIFIEKNKGHFTETEEVEDNLSLKKAVDETKKE